jgi:hypothetical protein
MLPIRGEIRETVGPISGIRRSPATGSPGLEPEPSPDADEPKAGLSAVGKTLGRRLLLAAPRRQTGQTSAATDHVIVLKPKIFRVRIRSVS